MPEEPKGEEGLCQTCGKPDWLEPFSGWRNGPGEFDMLCADCYETAQIEE